MDGWQLKREDLLICSSRKKKDTFSDRKCGNVRDEIENVWTFSKHVCTIFWKKFDNMLKSSKQDVGRDVRQRSLRTDIL